MTTVAQEPDDKTPATYEEALTEIARLRRLFFRRSEPSFGPFTAAPDGSVSMSVSDSAGAASFIIGTMAAILEGTNGKSAENYVQIGGWHPVSGRIECIVQRVGKLSPHDAREAAERELGRAVALLKKHKIKWTGKATFPPEPPLAVGIVPADDACSWLVVDANVSPNDLVCHRCGARQALAERTTADIFKATLAAFKDRHADCLEGDAKP